jgi:hypothetical protein
MRRSFCSLMLAIAALTACGGDGGSDPKVSLPGSYALSTVDSRAVPLVVIQDPDYKLEILSGSLVVGGNGTFTESLRIRETDANGTLETLIPCNGTYTQSGNTLVLTESESGTEDCGGNFSATWDGRNTVSVDYFGTVAVYKR